MNNYRVSVGIEPTDTYEKVKNDLVQVIKLIQSITPA